MKKCEYEYWDKKNKKFIKCGKEAFNLRLPRRRNNRISFLLCEEHREFVADALNKYEVEKTKAEMKKENSLRLFE